MLSNKELQKVLKKYFAKKYNKIRDKVLCFFRTSLKKSPCGGFGRLNQHGG
jgi:hypothetical protein